MSAGNIPSPQQTPQIPSAYDASTNKINPSVMTGFSYDAVGNLTSDPTTPANGIAYDGENRQTSYTKLGVGTTTYSYDGDGRRVKKVTGGPAVTTIYVYDAMGKLVAEYNDAQQQPVGGTKYLTADHLGSIRVVTGQNQAVVARYDYLPYGEEIGAGVGSRTVQMGYGGSDSTRQKFTSYERDTESGLDFAKNRYYSSSQGRYTSIDPVLIKSRHLINPQDLNRYTYVSNNPLKYIDPAGLEKIQIIVRTYIPAQKVTHPPGIGATFKGDYNEKGERVSARTEQRITVETEAKKGESVEYSHSVGKTVRLARGFGSMTGPSEGQADGKTLGFSVKRDSEDSVTVRAKGNEADPLIGAYTGKPGITYDFQISVNAKPNEEAGVSVSGRHDGFPAYEIVVRREDGTETTVYLHDPNKTGDGPQSLLGKGDIEPKDVYTVIQPKKKQPQ